MNARGIQNRGAATTISKRASAGASSEGLGGLRGFFTRYHAGNISAAGGHREPMPRCTGRLPTLGELHRPPGWVWLWCARVFPYRGHLGATLQQPGWAGNQIGFEPFPDDMVV